MLKDRSVALFAPVIAGLFVASFLFLLVARGGSDVDWSLRDMRGLAWLITLAGLGVLGVSAWLASKVMNRFAVGGDDTIPDEIYRRRPRARREEPPRSS